MSLSEATAQNPYATFGHEVARAEPSVRAAFIRRTYTHLAMAVYAFAALEWVYIKSGLADRLVELMLGVPYGMFVMFGLFMAVSWVADRWARSETSPAVQYAGLFGYVLVESLLVLPLIWMAQGMTIQLGEEGALGGVGEVNVLGAAGVATLVLFAGLTAITWLSGKDFSFLRAALGLGGVAVVALIVASMLFGMHLGTWFSVGMIVLASGYILYDTSNIMHHYRTDQHVAAALALFAAVALLFYYVLRLLIALSSRD